MSVEDYESLLETLDVLSDPETMSKLRQAQREVDAGDVVALETAAADLDARIAVKATDRPELSASGAEDGDSDDTPAPTA